MIIPLIRVLYRPNCSGVLRINDIYYNKICACNSSGKLALVKLYFGLILTSEKTIFHGRGTIDLLHQFIDILKP